MMRPARLLALPLVLFALLPGCPQPPRSRLYLASESADDARADAIEAYRALYTSHRAGKVDAATLEQGRTLYCETQGIGISLGLTLREARVMGDDSLADAERAARIARLTLELQRKATAILALLPPAAEVE